MERTLAWRIQHLGRHQKAVRHGDWKFIEHAGVGQLFNLARDISERRDLSIHQPEKLAELKRRLTDWELDLARSEPKFLVK